MKVSVIVPIYNVEPYIARCVESLMEQTLQEVEYIFVDDCATDNSIDILMRTLEKYPNRNKYVKVLKHKENKGLPAARNTGLKEATGKYIFHCDSDDYVESDMLKKLCEFAEEKNADYIWSDYYVSLNDGSRYKEQPDYVDVDQAFRGILRGEMAYNVWNKLVRKDLYKNNNIFFPSGNAMGEDMTMIMLLACATKVAYLHYGGYHYVTTNPGALTKKFSNEKSLKELLYNIKRASDFVSGKFGNKYSYEISCFKLNIKWSILAFNKDIQSYKLWHDSFPEANAYIFRQNVSMRIKVVEWCASKKLYWLVKLHYLLVIKFFYTITGK